MRRRRHLGARAAALVDGQLGHDARDRALAHLAHCARCRDEVQQQRELSARLRALPDPEPSAGLMALLHAAVPPGRVPITRAVRRVRTRLRLAAGSAVVLAGTLSGAILAGGGEEEQGPAVAPPISEFVLDHVAVSDQLPLTDRGAGAAAATMAGAAGR